MPPRRPRGRPSQAASRKYSGSHATVTAASVQRAGVNTPALRRLVELHHRGWLTRAEVEAAFGAPYDRLAVIAAIPYWRLS
jgi:hypothetical protein